MTGRAITVKPTVQVVGCKHPRSGGGNHFSYHPSNLPAIVTSRGEVNTRNGRFGNTPSESKRTDIDTPYIDVVSFHVITGIVWEPGVSCTFSPDSQVNVGAVVRVGTYSCTCQRFYNHFSYADTCSMHEHID